MATIHLLQTTTATSGQFVAGLTDFGPGRSKLFPNSADGYLKVHDQGPDWADVTEGSSSRLRMTTSGTGAVPAAPWSRSRTSLPPSASRSPPTFRVARDHPAHDRKDRSRLRGRLGLR
jgi:hypothetical protein